MFPVALGELFAPFELHRKGRRHIPVKDIGSPISRAMTRRFAIAEV